MNAKSARVKNGVQIANTLHYKIPIYFTSLFYFDLIFISSQSISHCLTNVNISPCIWAVAVALASIRCEKCRQPSSIMRTSTRLLRRASLNDIKYYILSCHSSFLSPNYLKHATLLNQHRDSSQSSLQILTYHNLSNYLLCSAPLRSFRKPGASGSRR